nr:MAG TPA: hypothetical protein [Caudoviricetes sp.]
MPCRAAAAPETARRCMNSSAWIRCPVPDRLCVVGLWWVVASSSSNPPQP